MEQNVDKKAIMKLKAQAREGCIWQICHALFDENLFKNLKINPFPKIYQTFRWTFESL